MRIKHIKNSSAGAQLISLKSFRSLGHFPNKFARVYKREHDEQKLHRGTALSRSCPPYAFRELVKAVYVDVPDKSSGKPGQKVYIEYDLVGFIPVDELLKAEQA